MASRPSRKDVRLLCDSVGPEDGLDPRYLRPTTDRAPRRKALQLCGQAREALVAALACCADEALRDLQVVAVTPAGGGRLLVTLRGGAAREAARGALERARGLLRGEVAAAVHRRKAPDLVYQVLEAPAG